MLRDILGIKEKPQPVFSFGPVADEDFPYLFGDDPSKVHVEVDNVQDSDTELIYEDEGKNSGPSSSNPEFTARRAREPLQSIGNQLNSALFDSDSLTLSQQEIDDDDDDSAWQLPKLKTPQRGESISNSLASLINTACTAQCDTDEIITRYKLPSNCEKLAPPMVNPEIWNDIAKKAQTYDRFLRDIQSLLATRIIPIIKLAEILKGQIKNNKEAKQMISDAVTLIGQAQFNLSLRRRYMIRPQLKKKYSNLCGVNTPITSFLFGDDIQKEIKKCDTSMSIAKDQYGNQFNSQYGPSHRISRGRSRGRGGSGRGFSGNNYQRGYSGNRYQPYPRQMRFQPQTSKKFRRNAPTANTEDGAM